MARGAVQRYAQHVLAIHADAAAAFADDADDGSQRGGLAHAVAPEQRHRFAFVHVQVDAVQRMAFAIPGVEFAYRQ